MLGGESRCHRFCATRPSRGVSSGLPSDRPAVSAGKPIGDRLLSHSWLWVIPLLALTGLLAILVFAAQVSASTRWGVFATGVAVAGAAALAGGLVGFLFGIPRTVQTAAAAGDQPQYQGNTNLEQVSDWLTKILVGVGLVQLGRALPALANLADSLKRPLGDTPSSGAFGLAIALAFSGLGFLYLYLWSRLRFAGELRDADLINAQIDIQEEKKTTALIVVNHQLAQGGTEASQNDLDETLIKAPDSTRILVFNQAERIRHDNWELNKPAMERTIPVFRALIAADQDDRYHRNHGSLGWALKDKQIPEWQQARDELTRAIQVRDTAKTPGWRVYEANRALCNIHLNNALPPAEATPDIIELINADLRTALTDPFAQSMVQLNADLQRWLAAHPLE